MLRNILTVGGIAALLTFATIVYKKADIEEDLTKRTNQAINADWAKLSFDGRDATIIGEAPNEEALAQATDLALQTDGVRVVKASKKDTGTPVAAQTEPQEAPSAEELLAKVKAELSDNNISFPDASLTDGKVTIKGETDTQGNIDKVKNVVGALNADDRIDYNMTVKAEAAVRDVPAELKAALGKAGYDYANLEFKDGKVTLKGEAPEGVDLAEITALMQKDTDVTAVDNLMTVAKAKEATKPVETAVVEPKLNEACDAGVKSIKDTKILFASGSSKLAKKSTTVLNKLVEIMKDCGDAHILLTGRTDSVGSVEKNKILSDKRVNNVKQHLISKGLDSKIIDTAAKPSMATGNKSNANDRRVDWTITLK